VIGQSLFDEVSRSYFQAEKFCIGEAGRRFLRSVYETMGGAR